jgi:hypothetical protein
MSKWSFVDGSDSVAADSHLMLYPRRLMEKEERYTSIQFKRPKELAAMLNVSEQMLMQWRANDSGPPFKKLGSSWKSPVRYYPADILAWIEKIRSIAYAAAGRGEFIPRKVPRLVFDAKEQVERQLLRQQVRAVAPELGPIPISWPPTLKIDAVVAVSIPLVKSSKGEKIMEAVRKLTAEERARRKAEREELHAKICRNLGWD